MKRISTTTRVVDKFGAGKDGYTDGNVVGGVPATDLEAALFDNLQEEIANVVEGSGLVLNAGVFTQLRQAVKRLFGGNVTTVNFAASPFALTADHAGLVLVDATAGNVVINLPAANVIAAPLKFHFVRSDASVNTATVNRAGADTFIGGTASFMLSGQGDHRNIEGDAVSKWASMAAGAKAGTIFAHGGATAPAGSMICPVAATNVSRATYAALFAAIGTTWGAGDGATTFGIPWFPPDYTFVQASGNVGTQSVGNVIGHTHSVAVGSLVGNNGGTGPGTSELASAGNTGTTGGAANLAAGSRVLMCVQF